MMKWNYLFGPVPSRRLGLSLGVDIIPPKTCPLDCVYCEAGPTTIFTLERKEYVPAEIVITELDAFLAQTPRLDYITFSGAGEPTLNSGIGKIISFLKSKYGSYKICLLTNGILLGREDVMNDLKGIDLVIPSLDAADEETFKKINRPCQGVTCAELIESLIKFRNASKIPLWLEIFIVPGINDSANAINSFCDCLAKIKPDKIQLNSLDRPGTESWVQKADLNSMIKIKNAFSPYAPIVEIISRYPSTLPSEHKEQTNSQIESEIFSLISRRPCTVDDISLGLKIDRMLVLETLAKLESSGKICSEIMPAGKFFRQR